MHGREMHYSRIKKECFARKLLDQQINKNKKNNKLLGLSKKSMYMLIEILNPTQRNHSMT